MPKKVDPEARRHEVAEAVFRVTRRDGLEHASLRNVAAEAGLAVGSVRHYFEGQTDIMIFAMRHFVDRVGARLLEHVRDRPGPGASADRHVAAFEAALAELLPLDAERREETEVWLAFTVSARTREELRPYAERLYDQTRELVHKVLTAAERTGVLRDGVDADTETERLYALVDGLALHSVLQPGRLDAEGLRAALRRHLDEIMPRAAGR
ncbi:TetR/AcrR family transcriptional regulator [Actinoallomurus spadix]|uniref:TetR/AcrR family transcriptional regulator n=1 Tax=Actinoallomurus spadix TaxID=79912 RepID=A0ABN0XHP3_9ACTN|nr:TetR/AcrR family transcriptional regulator [Actinoallomurus spadix]MCO5987627.1 TetR/AcrR family transcriptional regulator [Actinoallomurus spadix]